MEAMEIKGSAVKSITEFVRSRFPERYNEWFEKLPAESQRIMRDQILANNWYPLVEAVVEPTRQLAMFFEGDSQKAGWEAGYFSASHTLTGVYKIFVMIAKPSYIISMASKIFTTYYRPCSIVVHEKAEKSVTLHIVEFPTPFPVIDYRIAGWCQRALELSGCKDVHVTIGKSLTQGDPFTEIFNSWQ